MPKKTIKPAPAKAKPPAAKPKPAAAKPTKPGGAPVFERVYEIVMQIPRGRVLTYGVISDMLGGRLTAQGVGWALKALPDGSVKVTSKSAATKAKPAKTAKPAKQPKQLKQPGKYNSQTVPWQRVINSRGTTSTFKVGMPPDLQREILEKEGVAFDHEGKVDLKKYMWMAGLRDRS